MKQVESHQKNGAWPALDYEAFKSTQYLLHRVIQMMGKLKLFSPFEPHWANVPLWPISRGLTTGIVPYQNGNFTVTFDFIDHKILFSNHLGKKSELKMSSSSIAELFRGFQKELLNIDIHLKLNPMPQEIPNGVPFDADKENRSYDAALANNWWRILLSSYQVLMQYHALFSGISPSLGFMWGTFDLRDARYSRKVVAPPNSGYIERNAMDVEQVEAGWWSGNDIYPKSSYYSFTYPKPNGIENEQILPAGASWNSTLSEFILDYEVVQNASNPEKMLLEFFNSSYQVGAKLAGWDPKLINSGKPS